MKVINERGIEEILDFLEENLTHKPITTGMLNAWAADAENQMLAGNPPEIELRPWESVSGQSETFRISDAGVEDDGEDYFDEDGYND